MGVIAWQRRSILRLFREPLLLPLVFLLVACLCFSVASILRQPLARTIGHRTCQLCPVTQTRSPSVT
jgi:hypothetical protein